MIRPCCAAFAALIWLAPTAAWSQSDRWEPVLEEARDVFGNAHFSCLRDQSANSICAFVRCHDATYELGLYATSPDAAQDGDVWQIDIGSGLGFYATSPSTSEDQDLSKIDISDGLSIRRPFEREVLDDGAEMYAAPISDEVLLAFASGSVLALTPLVEDSTGGGADRPRITPIFFSMEDAAKAAHAVRKDCSAR